MFSLWFPRPKPVRVGDQPITVSQLRLWQLGACEAYVAERVGDPLDGLDPTDEGYDDDLKALYDELEAGWPPSLGSPEWSLALDNTLDGRAYFADLVCQGADPDWIAEKATTDEWQAIQCAAWGVRGDHKDRLVRAIDAFLGLPAFVARERGIGDGAKLTLAECVGLLVCGGENAEPLPWASPEVVGNLAVSQLKMVLSGGKAEEAEDPLPEDGELRDRVNAARAGFWGISGRPATEEEMAEMEPESIVESGSATFITDPAAVEAFREFQRRRDRVADGMDAETLRRLVDED